MLCVLAGWLSWAATHKWHTGPTRVRLPVALFVCFVVPLSAGAIATASATASAAAAACCATHTLVVGTLLEVDCNQITQATCFDKYTYELVHIDVLLRSTYKSGHHVVYVRTRPTPLASLVLPDS